MLRISLFVIIILIITIIGMIIYYSGFTKIVFKETKKKSFHIVYNSFIGPYKNTGPVSDKIYYDLLNNEKVETFKGFGIYYDNPKEVEEEKCRSIVGCILEEKDNNKIEELKKKGFNIIKIDDIDCIYTEFPFKGKISIIMGIIKVYPALEKYFEKKSVKQYSPIMEIYNVPERKITYIIPKKDIFPNFDNGKNK